MTIESEYKLRFAIEGVKVYACQKCYALVQHTDRQKHRQLMHSRKPTAPLSDGTTGGVVEADPLRRIPVTIGQDHNVVGFMMLNHKIKDEDLRAMRVSWMYREETGEVLEMALVSRLDLEGN